MTELQFVQSCSAPLEAAYGPMSEATATIYLSMLRDLEPSVLAAATAKCIVELKWLPKIAELRQAAADILQGRVQELSASEAWGLAYQAIRRIDFEIPHTSEAAQKSVPPLVWEAMRNAGLINLVNGYGLMPHKMFTESYTSVLTRDRKLRLAHPDVLKEIEQHRDVQRFPPSREAEALAKSIGSEN